MNGPVSRETARGVALMLQAGVALLIAVGGAWFAFWGLLWALWSWPLVAAEIVVAAAVAVDATSPRPRLVKINQKRGTDGR